MSAIPNNNTIFSYLGANTNKANTNKATSRTGSSSSNSKGGSSRKAGAATRAGSKKRRSNAGQPGLSNLPPELLHLISEQLKEKSLETLRRTSKKVRSDVRNHSDQEVIEKAKFILSALGASTDSHDPPGLFTNVATIGLQQSKNIVATSPYIKSPALGNLLPHLPPPHGPLPTVARGWVLSDWAWRVSHRVEELRFCNGRTDYPICRQMSKVMELSPSARKLNLMPVTDDDLEWVCEYLAVPGVFPKVRYLTITAWKQPSWASRTGRSAPPDPSYLRRVLSRGALPELVSISVLPNQKAILNNQKVEYCSGVAGPFIPVMNARAKRRPGVCMKVKWCKKTGEAGLWTLKAPTSP